MYDLECEVQFKIYKCDKAIRRKGTAMLKKGKKKNSINEELLERTMSKLIINQLCNS